MDFPKLLYLIMVPSSPLNFGLLFALQYTQNQDLLQHITNNLMGK